MITVEQNWHSGGNYTFGFDGPVVKSIPFTPINGLTNERSFADYTGKSTDISPPPNFLRQLISEEACEVLSQAFDDVSDRHPGRFSHFGIHQRSLFEIAQTNHKILPWDILTYVNFDGLQCYAPTHVSFSHRIMTAKWDTNPEIDFQIKRTIVERQIMDITLPMELGPNVDMYVVAIPEAFSHGATDTIFTQYPQEIKDMAVKSLYTCSKLTIPVADSKQVLYGFPTRRLHGAAFKQKIEDPAFLDYSQTMLEAWAKNFQMFKTTISPEDEQMGAQQMQCILRDLGALQNDTSLSIEQLACIS
jgi:hypothetical protein